MFGWLKKINSQIKDINTTVNTYKEETGNQTLPSVANLNRAKKLIEKNKFLEAKDLLYETIVIAPKDALIYKYLGECEEKLGNINGALDAYKESSALNPQDKNIWHKLGLVYINLKKYEDAEIAFEKADKVAPINTDIQTGWGMSLLKQQKYPQALEKFIKATQINRYNFSAMLLAAIVEIRLKKYDDADVKLNFLNQINPSEGSNYEYANLCFLREKYDDSIRYAKKSLEFNPNMFPAYILLGKLYSMKFDAKNSINQFLEAEKRDLVNPSLYSEWGYALVRLCRFSEAIEKFEKSLSEDSANNDTKSGIALCYAELGNIDEAQNILNFLEEQKFKNTCTETANAIMKQCGIDHKF